MEIADDPDPAILVGVRVGEDVPVVGVDCRCTQRPSGLHLVCPGTAASRQRQPSDGSRAARDRVAVWVVWVF